MRSLLLISYVASLAGCTAHLPVDGSVDAGAVPSEQDLSAPFRPDDLAEPADMAYHPRLYDDMTLGPDMAEPPPPPPRDMALPIQACPPDTGLEPNAPWPMAGHDAAHTSRSSYAGPTTLAVVATAPLTPPHDCFRGSLAVDADGTVYATSPDGLVAFSSDLVERWSMPTIGQAFTPTILADGSILFVASNDNGQGRIYSVSRTGDVLWTRDTEAPYAAVNGVEMAGLVLGCDGTAFALWSGAHDGATQPFAQLEAFRTVDGTPSWTFNSNAGGGSQNPRRGPTGMIYFDGPVAVDFDGELLYQTNPNACYHIDAIEPDGMLVSGPTTCTPDGQRLWNDASSVGAGPGQGGTALGADGTIYIPSFSSAAIDHDGNVLWRTPKLVDYADWSFQTSDIVLDGAGRLYCVLTDSGLSDASWVPDRPPEARLVALDAKTGSLIASYDFANYCLPTGIALGTNGRLFVSCGQLYAFGSPP